MNSRELPVSASWALGVKKLVWPYQAFTGVLRILTQVFRFAWHFLESLFIRVVRGLFQPPTPNVHEDMGIEWLALWDSLTFSPLCLGTWLSSCWSFSTAGITAVHLTKVWEFLLLSFFEPFSPLTSFAVLKVKRARDCGSVSWFCLFLLTWGMQHLSLSLVDWLLRAVGFAASPLSQGGGSYKVFLLVTVMFWMCVYID